MESGHDSGQSGTQRSSSEISPGLRRAYEHAEAGTVVPASRVGPVGVWVKRLVARLLRPWLTRQTEVNRGLIRAIHELERSKAGELEATVLAQGRHLDEIAAQVAELRRGASPTTAQAAPLPIDQIEFSARHRGDEAEIRIRLARYVSLFDAGPIVDLGCGRGEFLEACRSVGLEARGVDSDPAMVARCRAKDLDVIEADALAYLDSGRDASLGGIFAAQVVEHLTPAEIVELCELAASKLRAGGLIVIETINPESVYAMRHYYLDITHRQPVSAATLEFLLDAAGLTVKDVLYSTPPPEEERLRTLPDKIADEPERVADDEPAGVADDSPRRSVADEPQRLADAVAICNDNVEKLNDLLFGMQDYAVVAER